MSETVNYQLPARLEFVRIGPPGVPLNVNEASLATYADQFERWPSSCVGTRRTGRKRPRSCRQQTAVAGVTPGLEVISVRRRTRTFGR